MCLHFVLIIHFQLSPPRSMLLGCIDLGVRGSCVRSLHVRSFVMSVTRCTLDYTSSVTVPAVALNNKHLDAILVIRMLYLRQLKLMTTWSNRRSTGFAFNVTNTGILSWVLDGNGSKFSCVGFHGLNLSTDIGLVGSST